MSAGGVGTPESDVTHVVLDQPEGSAGGVTPSKNSERRKNGSHCPSSRSLPPFASAVTIFTSTTAAPATRNRQKTSRSRVCINLRLGFVVTESAVSLANSSRLPGVNLLPQSAVKGQHFSDSPRRSKKRKNYMSAKVTGGDIGRALSPSALLDIGCVLSRLTKMLSFATHSSNESGKIIFPSLPNPKVTPDEPPCPSEANAV